MSTTLDRDVKIAKAILRTRKTHQEIAEKYGVHRAYVALLASHASLRREPGDPVSREKLHALLRANPPKRGRRSPGDGSLTAKQIADQCGVSAETVRWAARGLAVREALLEAGVEL